MEEAIGLCEKIGFVAWLPAAYATYGLMLTRLGRIAEEALRYLEQGVLTNEAMGIRVYHAQRLCWWAEALWRTGLLEEARHKIEAAVELAVAMDERGVEVEALMTRALIATAEGATERAQEDLTRAVSISRSLETRLLEAQAVVTQHPERGLALCRVIGVEPWWRSSPR
jgi:tetratricopeptide (TPR) repeat protein